MTGIERSDATFTAWMRTNLDTAARHFAVTVTGPPVTGWRLRSLSAPVRNHHGTPRWLRICTEHTRWLTTDADWWTGNVDANTITGIRKPHVLDWTQWDTPDQQRRVRAELMTFLPERPCSPTDTLHTPITLPQQWWHDLRHSLEHLHTIPTHRFHHDTTEPPRVRHIFGDHVADALPRHWETVHGDLHWNNLTQPRFGLLDWEMWGRGPTGIDAATLYLHSLPTPDTATHVWNTFTDTLTTPTGHAALITAAARILHRTTHGDHPNLANPVRHFITPLINATTHHPR
ncbi:hypothetical protein GCM10022222_51420 [Amycolatopsis ultiminotia]|uniref:Aminoglycoside phosphotransferase n=1 Tax=Amycolatopsis ultiminotia TaxID=543629 RepID=A0ABP6X4L1_9PSEU